MGTHNFIKFSSQNGNLDISTAPFQLDSNGHVFLGQGTTNFISASSGHLEISASSFHLKDGNITASNVDLSGKLTSTEGTIGGFTIGSSKLSSGNLFISFKCKW